ADAGDVFAERRGRVIEMVDAAEEGDVRRPQVRRPGGGGRPGGEGERRGGVVPGRQVGRRLGDEAGRRQVDGAPEHVRRRIVRAQAPGQRQRLRRIRRIVGRARAGHAACSTSRRRPARAGAGRSTLPRRAARTGGAAGRASTGAACSGGATFGAARTRGAAGRRRTARAGRAAVRVDPPGADASARTGGTAGRCRAARGRATLAGRAARGLATAAGPGLSPCPRRRASEQRKNAEESDLGTNVHEPVLAKVKSSSVTDWLAAAVVETPIWQAPLLTAMPVIDTCVQPDIALVSEAS